MKALTLHQPWAWAIIHGPKRIENRTWAPPASLIGQRIAIHAGKTFDHDGHHWILQSFPDLSIPTDSAAFRRGAIIGSVELVGVERKDPGDPWWEGPVGWRLDKPLAYPEPIVCSGKQGLWEVPGPDAWGQQGRLFA